jgi:hypothetical protein
MWLEVVKQLAVLYILLQALEHVEVFASAMNNDNNDCHTPRIIKFSFWHGNSLVGQ